MKAVSSRRRVWIGLVLGVALICLAYGIAGRSTGSGDQVKFIVLWAGILVFLWPTARRLADPLVSESERLALLVAAGLFTYLPKFLRNPLRPVFYDEIAHWTQVERLTASGDLFAPNPAVRVLPSYPGLHTLTAGLRELTGLSTWQVGIVLVATLHVISAIGVYVLVKRVVASPVIGGLAGLLWCVAPGAMFFNSQFAYQSLAIVGFVWTIVAVAEAEAAQGRLRWRWVAVAAVLASSVVITHHVSSYALVVLLGCLTIAGGFQAAKDGSDDWKPAGLLLLVALVVNAGWMWVRGGGRAVRSIVDYLAPYPENGFDQLIDVVTRSGEARRFFVRSGLPAWEQWAAWLAPLAVIALGIVGVRLLMRMTTRPRSAAWGLVGFSVLYVAALPLVLTSTGAQGAHRSFPFTYLGVCLVAAAGLALLIGRLTERTGKLRRTAPLAVALLIGVITIGNTAANVNEFDRFPGPWEAGADSRARTDELDRAAAWLRGYDSEDRVVADLYTGTTLGVFGTVRPSCAVSAACPGDLAIWRFYDGQPIRPSDLRELKEQGYRFLAVDRRMAEELPRSGFWFNRGEEGAFQYTEPYPKEALSRLEGFTWLTKVYASTNYDLYEIHVSAADADVLEGEPGEATRKAEEERKAKAAAAAEGADAASDAGAPAEAGATDEEAGP